MYVSKTEKYVWGGDKWHLMETITYENGDTEPTATIIAPQQTSDEPKKEVVEQRYFDSKIICVESDFPNLYTVGKIYNVINGEMNDNLGPILYNGGKAHYKDLVDIHRHVGAKFIHFLGEQS